MRYMLLALPSEQAPPGSVSMRRDDDYYSDGEDSSFVAWFFLTAGH
jgi:hypothetical protein